jgi:hypothetical protein
MDLKAVPARAGAERWPLEVPRESHPRRQATHAADLDVTGKDVGALSPDALAAFLVVSGR